ncbi:hypothetical protein [Pseudophaeobacter leonis]|uniref:hypothetical protein n=1 Tax=Pseudophaeobacter leonis TaxID=1144477 RepID=UPI00111C39C9|nr:hypothetical protein [Pseudophaeobacter leonis]
MRASSASATLRMRCSTSSNRCEFSSWRLSSARSAWTAAILARVFCRDSSLSVWSISIRTAPASTMLPVFSPGKTPVTRPCTSARAAQLCSASTRPKPWAVAMIVLGVTACTRTASAASGGALTSGSGREVIQTKAKTPSTTGGRTRRGRRFIKASF